MGVGKNKTYALRQVMQGMFGLVLETFPVKLVEDNVESLLAGSDLIIDCTDNIEARDLIQGYE